MNADYRPNSDQIMLNVMTCNMFSNANFDKKFVKEKQNLAKKKVKL